MDELAQRKDQYVTLDASGLAVGLPAGLMGNSEVGHYTIGTGRVTYQVNHNICAHLCPVISSTYRTLYPSINQLKTRAFTQNQIY